MQISEVDTAVIYVFSVQRLPALLEEEVDLRVHDIFEFPWEGLSWAISSL